MGRAPYPLACREEALPFILAAQWNFQKPALINSLNRDSRLSPLSLSLFVQTNDYPPFSRVTLSREVTEATRTDIVPEAASVFELEELETCLSSVLFLLALSNEVLSLLNFPLTLILEFSKRKTKVLASVVGFSRAENQNVNTYTFHSELQVQFGGIFIVKRRIFCNFVSCTPRLFTKLVTRITLKRILFISALLCSII